MSKYIIQNGQFYEISDDELMHWKYIKREKKSGGGYRYYYADSKADVFKATQEMQRAGLIYGKASRDYKNINAQPTKYIPGNYANTVSRLLKSKAKKQAAHDVDVARANYENATKKYTETVKQFNKTYGLDKVADFLTKTSSAANKAKKWIKNIFS